MKRSKYVQLSLAAPVAMAISGCGPTEKTYDLQKKYNFQTVQQCADEKLPVDVCSDAYMTAMAEHRRIARGRPVESVRRRITLVIGFYLDQRAPNAIHQQHRPDQRPGDLEHRAIEEVPRERRRLQHGRT